MMASMQSLQNLFGPEVVAHFDRLWFGERLTQAHVICMNDFPEAVVYGGEALAEERLDELRAAYFRRNEHAFIASARLYGSESLEAYKGRCRWHIRCVQVAD